LHGLGRIPPKRRDLQGRGDGTLERKGQVNFSFQNPPFVRASSSKNRLNNWLKDRQGSVEKENLIKKKNESA